MDSHQAMPSSNDPLVDLPSSTAHCDQYSQQDGLFTRVVDYLIPGALKADLSKLFQARALVVFVLILTVEINTNCVFCAWDELYLIGRAILTSTTHCYDADDFYYSNLSCDYEPDAALTGSILVVYYSRGCSGLLC